MQSCQPVVQYAHVGTKVTWEIGKVLQEKILSALKSVTRGQQRQPFAAAFLFGDSALAQSHTHMRKTCQQVRPLEKSKRKERVSPALGLDLL